MAAEIFAMESMVLFAASIVDRDKNADVRLEAALCKLWASERSWEIINDTMQIRGGRGYETAHSLAARGEEPVPVERIFRDCRINTIFEGSSEIMRLFIAREMLDPHLKIGGPMLNSQLPVPERLKSGIRAAGFYATWYPKQWLSPSASDSGAAIHPVLSQHMRFAAHSSRRLAREIFHAMARYGPKLERQQVLLGRFVDIGAEIFAIASSCARAQSALAADRKADLDLLALADYFSRTAQLRIDRLFYSAQRNVDGRGYRLAQRVLTGDLDWLETGVV
jgi:Acyl-CoA dehydrogenase, C-terminal domain